MKVIQQLQAQIAELDKIERWRKEYEAHRWARHLMAAVEEHKKLMEMHNRWRDIMQAVTANLQHTVKHVLHRVQGRVGGKGKTSAKQKSSSSGGSSGGGDGGGDGDGPHRSRSKQKHRPSNSSHKSQRPPSVSPGASAHTSSPQVSPRRPSPGRDIAVILVILCLFGIALAVHGLVLQVLVILCLLIIALVALGHPEVAKDVCRLVPALLRQLAGPPNDES